MYDLKKVDDKFHEFLSEVLNEERFPFDELEITEKLLEQEEAFYIPFGTVSYFLVIEVKLPRLVEAVDFLELFWKSTSLIDNGP